MGILSLNLFSINGRTHLLKFTKVSFESQKIVLKRFYFNYFYSLRIISFGKNLNKKNR